MGLAFFVAAAPASSEMLQVALAAVLGGGGLAAVAAWRRAKPEAELSTVQSMQILLVETRRERDEARAEREAAVAETLFLRRRTSVLEARLRLAGIELPETLGRDPDTSGRREGDPS